MENFVHFTVDDVAFNGLLSFLKDLHSKNMKLIPVVLAELSNDIRGDEFVSAALTSNTLILDLNNTVLESKGVSNSSVYLDFFNNNSYSIWYDGLYKLYNLTNFDGIWLDMNEPTTLLNG
jgi:alpha-glucosidase (family GH31 glycosyl hydrolase)